MKRLILSFFLCLGFGSLFAARQTLVLDSIITGDFNPLSLPEMKPMLDARCFTCLDDAGQNILRFNYQTGKQQEIILDLRKAKGEKPDKITGYEFSFNEAKILFWTERTPIYRRSYLTEYYVYDCKRNLVEPLSADGAQRDAHFSPDGRSVAFARDHNLYIKRLDFGTEIQVTTDGSANNIINGVADWVYEEEFTETCAYDWSPDGQFLAYVKFNEKNVPTYSFPLYGAFTSRQKLEKYYPGLYSYKYPAAGEMNSVVTVWVFNLQTRSSRQMEVPMSEDDYIPRIRFTRYSSQLAVMTLNRSQNTFKMFFANPKSAQSKMVLTEQNEKYVAPMYDAIRFSTRNFTYVSEKDGYRHLYLYGANGGLQKQLTTGKWDLTKFLGCDTIRNVFYYQSDEESPIKRDVYSVDMKGRKLKISTRSGCTDGTFNADFTVFVQSWSNINTPHVYSVCNTKGEELRGIENNKDLKAKLSKYDFKDKVFISVPAADGQKLNGWMLKPSDFNPDKKYPVVLIQYGGPDAQLALDAFDLDWEYYLADKGYLVVCVDGRGTGGRGEAFRKSIWCRLGELETEDQVSTANYLKTLSYVDGSRMGIWGWSYGGYVTLMTMTDPSGIFKAGVAVAPVCDWRYYNTVYTERFMRTPKENEDGYDRCSPLLRAERLKGRLLLVHGMADDNVRTNQTLDMTEALIRAGVQFDMQLYPTSNHSILGDTYRKHLFNRMADFFQKNL
jgi:dipeptidyl-peptidase 4